MSELLERFTQKFPSGGVHTPPELRLLLYALGVALRATEIVETGYDAGVTTEALALTGAHVVGIDNLSQYSDADAHARERLASVSDADLVRGDALHWLEQRAADSVDLIFVDDNHDAAHVKAEARQVRRILRPGGIAVFHDTKVHRLSSVVREVFGDWPWLDIPAISPQYQKDFGAALVRRPEE